MQEFINFISQLGTQVGLKILYAVFILIVGLRLVKVLTKLLDKSKGLQKIDPSVRMFLKSFISITLKVLVFVTVAVTIGIPASSFVTVIASAGVAIGLALQGALSNLAGGLMLLLFRPFKVGDFIENGGNSGVVKSITIFYTVLTTVDNRTVTMPNGTLTNSVITNYSANPTRRVDLDFSVSYTSDSEQVKKTLLDVSNAHEKVLKEPAPFAAMTGHADSALIFTLRVWCSTADYWDVRFDLTQQVKAAFDEAGISIPFPQIDVHLDK